MVVWIRPEVRIFAPRMMLSNVPSVMLAGVVSGVSSIWVVSFVSFERIKLMMRNVRIVRKDGHVQVVRIWAKALDLHNMRLVVDKALSSVRLSLTDVRIVHLVP